MKNVNVGIKVLPYLIFIFSITSASGQCPEPPRNIQYSENFYKAQSYFMENSSDLTGDLGVIVEGVPLGGSMANKNYSHSGKTLTQAEALSYFETELTNYRTQLAAEALSTLCKVSTAAITSFDKSKAIDAIQIICELVLSPGSISNPNINRLDNPSDFNLLPHQQYAFFTEGTTQRKKTVSFFVSNPTQGDFRLKFVPSNKNITLKSSLENSTFKLAPGERKKIEVEILLRDDAKDQYTETFDVEHFPHGDHYITGTINVFPNSDILPPILIKGKIQTNAIIHCSVPDFTAGHTEGFPLPYGSPNSKVGPDDGTRKCFALTESDLLFTYLTNTSLSASFHLTSDFGGKCGAGGAGGDGSVQPRYLTSLTIPNSSRTTSWKIGFNGIFTGMDIGLPVTVPSCNVYFYNIGDNRGNPIYSFPFNGTSQGFSESGILPGTYNIEVVVPKVYRACYGSAGGIVAAQASIGIILDISVIRSNTLLPSKNQN